MRQLKFRICYTDRQDNKYIIYDAKKFFFHIGLDGNILENYGDCVWQVPFDVWDHPFIQQSTGMKDCDGVEIYEGDLVDFDVCISSNKGEFESYKQQEVKYCEVNGVYVFGKDEFCMLDHIVKHTVKVTGNVFNETA
jgi:uncharacterized phage protein (TIGR01671 family)